MLSDIVKRVSIVQGKNDSLKPLIYVLCGDVSLSNMEESIFINQVEENQMRGVLCLGN